jgi:hypothetical protein
MSAALGARRTIQDRALADPSSPSRKTARGNPARAPSARGGYTLVELALVAVILTVAMGSLTLFGDRSVGALGASTSQAELDSHLRRTLTRIGEELLPSGLSVITPDAGAPLGSSTLTYRKSAGPVNGANSWGASQRFSFAYEAGELDDGQDNNSNGLVDEGVVQWTLDVGSATEQTVVLCHAVRELDPREVQNNLDDDGDGLVDEPGFVFQRDGDLLRISLALERLDGERHPIVRTLETTVQPRN